MSANLYHEVYECIALDSNHQCIAYQQKKSGAFTPELAGIIIMFACMLNLVVFGFKSSKRTI